MNMTTSHHLASTMVATGSSARPTGAGVSMDAIAPPGRKKPLRTYSRRSVLSNEPALPSPERSPKHADLSDRGPTETSPPAPRLPTPRQPRGSILAYFNALPSRPSITPATACPKIAEPSPPHIPPPTPLLLSNLRKRRRLTTRPGILGVHLDLFNDSSQDTSEEKDGAEDGDEKARRHGPEGLPSPPVTATNSLHGTGTERPLSDGISTDPLANLTGTGPSTSAQAAGHKKRCRKRAPKDMVQTTLSLSIKPDPGFTLCKECGILYNPLNEKDRKEHKTRHAAHVRSKRKAELTSSSA
ncbi:hypothetical protein B0T22DRAFT_176175 [Podospora appendiculata]|uniref:N-acetyltransferase ESCO zinc-finger domain-containing protein n=1 Tax=Podospora appendiculata TaxID=314037 RepID=A0AAE0XBN7_9PEZI|nr:hypothetical protein B0T22DRAFT_176175 [Podospora appendiculata]